jgi:endoglucanase
MKLSPTHDNSILTLKRAWRFALALLATSALALVLGASSALAGVANGGVAGAPSDPIAGLPWGAPPNDDLGGAYLAATGAKKVLLAKLALKPRALWLGWWWPTSQVRAEAAQTVAATENGNPNVITQFVTFELHPWEQKKSANGPWYATPNAHWNVAADEAWYRNMAQGIGHARAMVIVQADLPFEFKTTSPAPAKINAYAVRVLGANPHTTVYLNGGTVGWLTPLHAAQLLIRNGIRYARGFSLNDTDYDPTAKEDLYGAQVVMDLAKLGVPGKHFIVNTDENGQPFKPDQVTHRAINNAPACHGKFQSVCQRTGIPPTTNVGAIGWHLGPQASAAAKRYCDGYVWTGRPWDHDAGPFDLTSALWLAGNGEF